MSNIVQVKPGQLYKGLSMFREFDYFTGGAKVPKITVFYYEWLESPTGDKIEEKYKKYHIADELAVYRTVKDEENGEESQVLVSAENLGYTAWLTKLIIPQYVGITLGQDLIIGSIKQKLTQMPFEVVDDHIARPNE
jgi:hypothetical protein